MCCIVAFVSDERQEDRVKNDLGKLIVRKVIIHEIPRHSRSMDGGGPILSEVESPLNKELQLYFRERIIASLKSPQAFDIMFEPAGTSPVPGLVLDSTSSNPKNGFVSSSQEMAKHLFAMQTGSNPSGLLSVIDCQVGSHEAVALIKLEKEEGARLQQDTIDGKRTFDIQHLRDLILTENTKVFKIGLFVQTGQDLGSIDAGACDHQRGYRPRTEIADFFLKRFLGCKLLDDPMVSTKRFYDATEKFINDYVEDPLRRTKYYNHLVSELTSQKGSLSPKSFAEKYLVVADRQKYLDYLESQNVAPTSFPRETDLISARLEKRVLEFRSGIAIVTPHESSERVKLSKLENGEIKAEVQDFLKTVKGK